MSTFIDRLETDLVRVCEAQIAPRRSWRATLQSLSRRARLRMLAALTAVAAVATPAIAIGVGPVVRDFFGQPVSTTADAPPAQQLALLGILRDPPPGASVDPATLGSWVLPEIHGIRTNYIRLLPPAPGFPHQLLYTVASGELGAPDPAVGANVPPETKNLICVEQVEASGVGGDCTPTWVLASGHWRESAGLDGYGLVPDGVATVVLHYPDHPPQTETVTENTFSWQGYPAPAGPIINGGGDTSPGPTPEIPSSITWLNANGEVLATHIDHSNAVAARRSNGPR
jgi:hypothetical protein